MKPATKYADIAIALPVFNTFTYGVPESLKSSVSTGKRALVPFGRRSVTGYIVAIKDHTEQRDVKNILDVLDEKPLFPSSLIPFFSWMADYYMHPIGEVIKNALPGGLNLYDFVKIVITEAGEDALIKRECSPAESVVLKNLKQGPVRLKDLRKDLKREVSSSVMGTLENNGWILQKREFKGARTKPKMERYVSLLRPDLSLDGLSVQRKRIVETLASDGDMPVAKLKEGIPGAPRLIKPLEKAGYLKIYKKRIYRDPFGGAIEADHPHTLTDEQEKVFSEVLGAMGKGFSSYLLAGVTGSGKTEVYMQLAARAIERGYPVLVLVPEIALISQMERRFRARFGECVAVLHSGLSSGERYDQWIRILNKDVFIAIGARSAVFAPFENVGLIIVDEEHDTSYKQETGFRYNARDLAVVRAKLNNGIVLLGSATPSVQSYYNVKAKKFSELTLSRRARKQPLPRIAVVDLSSSRDNRGIRRFITPELHKAMSNTLDKGEQVLLFLNRRGFAGFPVCADCGESLKCRNCEISMTFHQEANAYKCHYCGFMQPFSSRCNGCSSSNIKLLGLGTEKVESAVKTLFPEARVARMDRDTTTRKGSLFQILKGIRNHDIDIIVGTQLVAKGHDFPDITLVGIICADLSLSFPDFRAGERTFQLLAQVAGRAGRGDVPGRVVLQTYNPQHFSILAAKAQDFKTFYEQEIVFRKELNYPPFARIIQFQISGKDKIKTEKVASMLGDTCRRLHKGSKSFVRSVEILGPIASPLAKIAKKYRWQILLKGLGVRPLHEFVHQVMDNCRPLLNNRNVKVTVDVDPFSMM